MLYRDGLARFCVRLRAFLACVAFLASGAGAGAAPGLSSNEIVLGQSIYLTGALAELGQDFTAGAAAYFKRINEAGGVNGRRIRVVTLDDAYDPKRAVANAVALEAQGVFAFWQFAGTGTVHEVTELAERHQVPLIAAIATGPALRAVLRPHTFYVRAGNAEELRAVVEHLLTSGLTRVAVAYVDAPYGNEGLAEVEAAMKAHGKALVAKASFKLNGDGAEAVATELARIAPQAVVMVTVPASTKAFVAAARKAALGSQLYALNAGLPIGAAHELGELAHGVIVCQVMPNVNDQSIPVVHEYRDAYRAFGRTNYTSASLEGYINAKVFVEALRHSGLEPTRQSLLQSLEALSALDVGGYTVHYSHSSHAGSRRVELSIVSTEGQKFIY
jgi:ABC-type branched-subunit amino acid transport system substrate-binding protein